MSSNDLCAMICKRRQEEVVERKEVGKDNVRVASLNALNFCLYVSKLVSSNCLSTGGRRASLTSLLGGRH